MRRVFLSAQPGWRWDPVAARARPLAAQDLAKRLILKDGSYQSVTKYEIKGERVRYLSAERGEWEELPKSLVDWPATEKYEKDRAAGASTPEAAALDKELEADARHRKRHSLRTSRPDCSCPKKAASSCWTATRAGPNWCPIDQRGGAVNKNMKGNILRAAVNPDCQRASDGGSAGQTCSGAVPCGGAGVVRQYRSRAGDRSRRAPRGRRRRQEAKLRPATGSASCAWKPRATSGWSATSRWPSTARSARTQSSWPRPHNP